MGVCRASQTKIVEHLSALVENQLNQFKLYLLNKMKIFFDKNQFPHKKMFISTFFLLILAISNATFGSELAEADVRGTESISATVQMADMMLLSSLLVLNVFPAHIFVGYLAKVGYSTEKNVKGKIFISTIFTCL